MRLSHLLVIACVLVGTTGIAQDKKTQQVDYPKLINALASENPAPTKRSGPDLCYPVEYDRKKQEPVRSATYELKTLGTAAFKSLVGSWDDERYCLTYSVGINGYMNNATVGKMCRVIVYDQIQPYGILPQTDDDPRGKPKRPAYPSVFLADAKEAEKWLEEHKDKSLYEIQLMAVDWVIQRESANPKDFTGDVRGFMKKIRKKLLDTKKPIARGNYYMDDYD